MVAKKTAKKTTKKSKSKRTRCVQKGCRRLAVLGDTLCAKCRASIEADATADPMDAVERLAEMDRLRYVEIQRNLENQQQEIDNHKLSQRLDDNTYHTAKGQRQRRILQLEQGKKVGIGEQRALLAEFAKKYSFDPKQVSFDEITGLIHRLESEGE